MNQPRPRSEEHTSELQSPDHLVCRLLLEKKKKIQIHKSILENKKNREKKQNNVLNITLSSPSSPLFFLFLFLLLSFFFFFFFFFNDTATTEIYTLSLHDALPICSMLEKIGPTTKSTLSRSSR